MQQTSDLTVGNLYYYFNIRDESKDELEPTSEPKLQPTKAAPVNFVAESFTNSNLQQEIFKKLQNIIAEQLVVDSSTIKLSTDFNKNLGADSLDVIEVVMAIEEEFDIEIPDEAAEEITTIQQAVDYISRKIAV